MISRILNGEKPANLPILDPPASELVISVVIAGQLGISIPDGVIGRASEIIK